MTSDGASLIPGLAWELTPGMAVGAQIESHLRDAMRAGHLRAGDALPSSRRLADHLRVSRGTVSQVYEQLAAEGYVDSRPGAVPRVAMRASAPLAASSGPRRESRLMVDFRPGVPDLASFPVQEWLRSVGEAARGAGSDLFGYGDPHGDHALRSELASYLRRVRGAATEVTDIVVCSGFAQGAALVLEGLRTVGIQTVAVEDPGDLSVGALAARVGLGVVPVAVDEDGLDVVALSQSGARAVVVTPAHQSPTGAALSSPRRKALVDWAERVDGFIIEDDYDSEFRYDRAPLGVVQGLASSRVALIGSTSKTLAPALRLGWVVAPAPLVNAVADIKFASDRGSPSIEQRALAHMMTTRRYDRHVRRMRGVYSHRRRVLADAVLQAAPLARLSGLAGGFHALLHLPEGASEAAVVAAARERSIGLYPLSGYRTQVRPAAPALVIGFGNCSTENITAGIAEIADLLEH